jgi:hypothetical protein
VRYAKCSLPALGRQRQENQEFVVNLSYIERSCLKNLFKTLSEKYRNFP